MSQPRESVLSDPSSPAPEGWNHPAPPAEREGARTPNWLLGLVALLVLFAGAVAWWTIVNMTHAASDQQDIADLAEDVVEAKYLAADTNGWQSAYALALHKDANRDLDAAARSRQAFLATSTALTQTMESVGKQKLTDDERRALETAQERFARFMAIDAEIYAQYTRGDTRDRERADQRVLGESIVTYYEVAAALRRLSDLVLHRGDLIAQQAQLVSRRALATLVTFGVATVLLLGFLGWLTATSVRRNRELMDRLESLSRTDVLTGIANRRVWNEELPRGLARAQRLNLPMCVAIIDLDHFKRFNDTKGHLAGDALLADFGKLLRERIRGDDLAARFGGEEFVLMLHGCTLDNATQLVESLREAMPAEQTFSAGVAESHGDDLPEDLLRRADAALYRAKERGRNRTIAAPPMGESTGAFSVLPTH